MDRMAISICVLDFGKCRAVSPILHVHVPVFVSGCTYGNNVKGTPCKSTLRKRKLCWTYNLQETYMMVNLNLSGLLHHSYFLHEG